VREIKGIKKCVLFKPTTELTLLLIIAAIFLMSLLWYLFVINYILFLLGYLWVVSSHNYFIDPVFLCAFIPIKSYSNAETEKGQILKENKKKSGVYM
jgi:hypothetical protein